MVNYNYLYRSGFSLLEILMTLGIISSVFLTIIAIQITNLRQVHLAYYRTVALTQAQAMLERLRVTGSNIVREQEQILWRKKIQSLLPKGAGHYSCFSSGQQCTVWVYWQTHELNDLSLSAQI